MGGVYLCHWQNKWDLFVYHKQNKMIINAIRGTSISQEIQFVGVDRVAAAVHTLPNNLNRTLLLLHLAYCDV